MGAVNSSSGTSYPSEAERVVHTRGFAILVHQSDYLDLITRHPELHQGNYGTYLADIHDQMKAARQIGHQVLVGPFLPDQYESYAEAIGEPAGLRHTVRSYDDFVARLGPHTRLWEGEPMGRLVALLRASTDNRANQAKLLPLLKQAAELHSQPELALDRALDTAAAVVSPLLRRAEPGHHTLTCDVQMAEDLIDYVLPVVRTKELVAFPDDGSERLLWAAMAIAQLAARSATLVLRTRPLVQEQAGRAATTGAATAQASARSPDRWTTGRRSAPLLVRMWRLDAGQAVALTAGQAFAIACIDPRDGQIVPPEPCAEYVDAFAADGDYYS